MKKKQLVKPAYCAALRNALSAVDLRPGQKQAINGLLSLVEVRRHVSANHYEGARARNWRKDLSKVVCFIFYLFTSS